MVADRRVVLTLRVRARVRRHPAGLIPSDRRSSPAHGPPGAGTQGPGSAATAPRDRSSAPAAPRPSASSTAATAEGVPTASSTSPGPSSADHAHRTSAVFPAAVGERPARPPRRARASRPPAPRRCPPARRGAGRRRRAAWCARAAARRRRRRRASRRSGPPRCPCRPSTTTSRTVATAPAASSTRSVDPEPPRR